MGIKRFVLFVTLFGLASLVPGSPDFGPQAAAKPHPVVSFATRSATTAPLREMPEIPPLPDVIGEIFEKPLKRLPNRAGGGGAAPDPVAQTVEGNVAAATIGAGFEGIGILDNTTLCIAAGYGRSHRTRPLRSDDQPVVRRLAAVRPGSE